jgi:hypothetical protein
MVEAVEDVDGGFADPAGGEQVFNHTEISEKPVTLSGFLPINFCEIINCILAPIVPCCAVNCEAY